VKDLEQDPALFDQNMRITRESKRLTTQMSRKTERMQW